MRQCGIGVSIHTLTEQNRESINKPVHYTKSWYMIQLDCIFMDYSRMVLRWLFMWKTIGSLSHAIHNYKFHVDEKQIWKINFKMKKENEGHYVLRIWKSFYKQ